MKIRFIKDLIITSLFYAYVIAMLSIFWHATGIIEMGVIFIPAIIIVIVLTCITYAMLYREYKLEVELVMQFKTIAEGYKNLSIAEDLVKNRKEENDILCSVRWQKLYCDAIKERINMLSEQKESEDTE